MPDLSAIMSKVQELPTLPDVSMKILKLVNESSTSTQSLAKIIERDPALATKILKFINSAYFSLSRKITNIQQAVTYLGFHHISQLVISVTIFSKMDFSNGVFSMENFWIHSMFVADYSKILAIVSKKTNPDDAYTAGLLHDIGKMFLIKYLTPNMEDILSTAFTNKSFLYDEEYAKMKIDHNMTGEWLSKNWKLPGYICDACHYHNMPFEKRKHVSMLDPGLVNCVSLANKLMNIKLKGYSGSYGEYTIEKAELDALGVSVTDLVQYESGMEARLQSAKEMLHIIKE